jgi:hypothetical protein
MVIARMAPVSKKKIVFFFSFVSRKLGGFLERDELLGRFWKQYPQSG